MRAGSLISILFSLGLAAFIAYLGNSWLDRQVQRQEPDLVPTLAAARDIPIGAKIEPPDLRFIKIAPNSVPEGAFTAPEELLGQVPKEPIYAGEIILARRLLGDPDGNILSAILKPGMRAITVGVNEVSGVSGFLLPGSRVDVIAKPDDGGAHTLLQSIEVLAAGQQLQATGDSAMTTRAVTLAVDPRQAEVLADATASGDVRLTLRNEGDLDYVEPPPVPISPPASSASQAQDVSIRPDLPVQVAPLPPETAAPNGASAPQVTVIRGVAPELHDLDSMQASDLPQSARPRPR